MRCSPCGWGRTCHSDGVSSIVSYSNWQPTLTSMHRAWLATMNLSLPAYFDCVNLAIHTTRTICGWVAPTNQVIQHVRRQIKELLQGTAFHRVRDLSAHLRPSPHIV